MPLPDRLLARLLPGSAPIPTAPRRIVLIQPCCIGDVVMATAALAALQTHYPAAHITWAVGGWSKAVVDGHPLVDAVLDTGPAANPAAPRYLRAFVGQLRAGGFDMAVSLVRSRWMSAAVLLAGIPVRVGLDSGGRGFGYNVRVPVDLSARRHEVDIYLDAAARLGADVGGLRPMIPLTDEDIARAGAVRAENGITGRYLVVNPSGGVNPGAQMDAKRYPPGKLAALVNAVVRPLGIAQVVIAAGPGDDALVSALARDLARPAVTFVGSLRFREIGALAVGGVLYLGNDTGLTHVAAACGARTVMLLGPTDPARYGAYSPEALNIWKPGQLAAGGFAGGVPPGWNWDDHGIGVDEAAGEILSWYTRTQHNATDV